MRMSGVCTLRMALLTRRADGGSYREGLDARSLAAGPRSSLPAALFIGEGRPRKQIALLK